jgi:ADP-ribose pyrophosphatase
MSTDRPVLLSKTLLFQGHVFNVFEYEIQLADRIIKRDIIERASGVVVVPIDKEYNVILEREYCAGSNTFVLSLPGGSCEGGDPAEDAMRELREETGYRAEQLIKLHFHYSAPSTTNRKSHVYLGFDLIYDPLPKQADEIINIVRLPLDEAIASAYQDFESDGGTVGSLLMARDKIRELGL